VSEETELKKRQLEQFYKREVQRAMRSIRADKTKLAEFTTLIVALGGVEGMDV